MESCQLGPLPGPEADRRGFCLDAVLTKGDDMKIRHMVPVVILLTAVSFAHAQEDLEPRPGLMPREHEQEMRQRRTGGPEGRPGGGQEMLLKMITSPRFSEELGLTEEQRSQIHDELWDLRAKGEKLHDQMQETGRRQAELLVADPFDEAALMAAIEETGRIRTELAKLRVRPLIVLREVLTADQLQTITAKMERRREAGPKRDSGERRKTQRRGDEVDVGERRDRGEKMRRDRAEKTRDGDRQPPEEAAPPADEQ